MHVSVVFGWLVILGLPLVTPVVQAETIKVEKVRGHVSPMMVKITLRDNSVRTALLRGIGHGLGGIHTHDFTGLDNTGSESSVWFDTVRQIKPASDEEATFVMKDGTILRLKYQGSGNYAYRFLHVVRSDGGYDRIDLVNVRSVDFLHPARVDMKGFAMFDQWEYSPYTGEPLGKQVSRR